MLALLVLIDCGPDLRSAYAIKANVSGLKGSGLELWMNGHDPVLVDKDSEVILAYMVGGYDYNVTVKTQPSNPAQTCVVANATGVMGSADVTVAVTCANTYAISGMVTGLQGPGLVLNSRLGDDNKGEDLQINCITETGSVPFAFATRATAGTAYAVRVKTHPTVPAQTCSVEKATGTIENSDVQSVNVICSTKAVRIGGTVSGLVAGTKVLLQNNGIDDVEVTGGATSPVSFTFPAAVASGTSYVVTVKTQPTAPSQICRVGKAAGITKDTDVLDVSVVCCGGQKCNCPQNSGPDYYADAVSSGVTGLYGAPTGVSDPPDCRFKTITEALDAANLHGSGSRAIATGGSDQNPVIFSAGETFPLEVKPGVTLTTSDTTPTPAHHVIEVAEAGPSRPVVQLDEDAAVAGFTIRPAGSGSASDTVLVKCQTAGSGTASVNGMVLDGKGTLAQAEIDYALHVTGACNASASEVAAVNCLKSGVLLESTGGATITVAGVTATGNGDTGFRVWLNSAGTVALNLNQNEITQNFATSNYGPPNRTVGGVLFFGNKPASLTFERNRVYGNKGDQILLFSGQKGWTLNGGSDSSVCGNGSNTIACYDSGAVGLSEISNGTVDARFNEWSNYPPMSNVDYFQTGAGIINATGAGNDVCPVVTMSCP